FRHLGIEQNLQQQIAEFARKLGPVPIIDRLEHLVSFFERIGLDGIESLLPIPRASSRSSQPLHCEQSATWRVRGAVRPSFFLPLRFSHPEAPRPLQRGEGSPASTLQ